MEEENIIGKAGGDARSRALSDERRKEIASLAAKAMWEKRRANSMKKPPRYSDANLPELPIPNTKRSGDMLLGSWSVPCFVLSDDQRVISQRAFLELLGFKGRGDSTGHRLLAFLDHPTLQSSYFQEIRLAIQQPIKFLHPNKFLAFGYTGETVIDYCRAILKARQSRAFEGEVFARYAEAAEVLVSSVAKVGIVALIDEATGNQETRARNELQQLLDKYLKKEFAAWAKRFPDEFYQEMFRLKGWEWHGMKVNRPQVVGTYTNDLIYSRLTPGMLEELQRLNPSNEDGLRHHRHHQHLTADIGHPALQQHLYAILGMMRASTTWAPFVRMVDRAFPRIGATYALALDDDELNQRDGAED